MADAKPDVHAEHLKALGEICVRFQMLELVLSMTIVRLFDQADYLALQVTCELSFRNLTALACNIMRAKTRDKALVEEWEAIIAKATEAEQNRNRLIHSIWIPFPDGEVYRLKITAKQKGPGVQCEKVSPDDLQAVIETLKGADAAILAFCEKLVGLGIMKPRDDSLIPTPEKS